MNKIKYPHPKTKVITNGTTPKTLFAKTIDAIKNEFDTKQDELEHRFESEILNGQSQMTDASAQISAVQASCQANAETIASNTANITTNKTSIDTLQTNLQTAQTDISNLQTSVQTNTQNIASNKEQIDTNSENLTVALGNALVNKVNIQKQSEQISALQNDKQNKLTAGENILIDDATNTISATAKTYTAGQNIAIDENNVISATSGDSGISSQVEQISADIEKIKQQLTEWGGFADQNKLQNQDFVPYDTNTIVQTQDTYDRDLQIETKGTAEMLLPNILFSTNTQTVTTADDGTKTTTQATANIDFYFTYIPSLAKVNGAVNFAVFDGDTQIASFSSNYIFFDVDIKHVVTYTLKDYACTTSGHNLYVVATPTDEKTKTTITRMKVTISAPNVVILNKIEPFDVEYNYYDKKYYLSNCTAGTAKICEIDAGMLTRTSDIVWQDTGIEAQNFRVFFTVDPTTQTAINKHYVITHKNNTVEVTDGKTSYVLPPGFVKAEPFVQKNETIKIICKYESKNDVCCRIFNIPQTLDSYKQETQFSNYDKIADFEVNRQYWEYCSSQDNKTSMIRTSKDGSVLFCQSYMTDGQIKNTSFKNGTYMKSYMTKYSGTYLTYFDTYFNYYGTYVCLPVKINFHTYLRKAYVVGKYDDFFCGANNDYFCVVKNKLYYYTNLDAKPIEE